MEHPEDSSHLNDTICARAWQVSRETPSLFDFPDNSWYKINQRVAAVLSIVPAIFAFIVVGRPESVLDPGSGDYYNNS
jgi:hypothetical protein